MTEKTITIKGKEYPIVFDMQTIMHFETVAGKSVFKTQFETLRDRLAVTYAAVISADENTSLTFEEMVGNKTLDDFTEVVKNFHTVSLLMGEFFKVPDIEKELEPEPQPDEENDEGEKPKN